MAITNGDTSARGQKIPEIYLDTTLAELLAGDNNGKLSESLCSFKPCADPRHTTVPLNKKFLITSTKAKDSADIAHLQLENVSYLLSWWAGNMEVLMVACEGRTDDPTLTGEAIEKNAKLGFSVVNEKQRPIPRVFANGDDYVKHYQVAQNPIRWAFAVDLAEKVPCVVKPEVQYLLNSKRWLAVNPLESAHDQVLDPGCSCTQHKTKDGLWYYGGKDCSTCKDEIEKELSRLETKLKDRPAPFVLKLTSSLGSVGTMIAKDEKSKSETINTILKTQREYLPNLTEENAHIYPASLVLSDFLPGETHALNIFINRDGSVKFLGSCNQLGTRISGGGRQHTSLTWSDQEKLQKKFQATLDDIGKVLHDHTGYHGPCGADIMINPKENDKQYVIDLNVRTPISLALWPLGTHCKSRGFDVCAIYECLLLSKSREDLEEMFAKEFSEGRLILMGTTRLGTKDVWAYPTIVCGEDDEAVAKLGRRVTDLEAGTIGGGGDDDETADAGGA